MTLRASDHTGKVTLTGVSIPGATVTAKQGEKTIATITDQNGIYKFTELADGAWTITVSMVGFETMTREVTLPSSAEGVWELTLLPIEKIIGALPAPRPVQPVQTSSTNGSAPKPGQPAKPGAAAPQTGFQRAGVNQVATAPPPPVDREEPPPDPNAAAAGLLINGSVNNGAASPFAQARAFGTNRPNQRSLYSYAAGLQLGNSSWDARQFSFSSSDTARPSYTDAQFLGSFQGPIKVPGLRNRLNFFVNYQGTSDHNAQTQASHVPTALERLGDFSHSRQRSRRAGADQRSDDRPPLRRQHDSARANQPAGRGAAGLLPVPQTPTAASTIRRQLLTFSRTDGANTRLAYSLNNRNQLQGTFADQRTRADLDDAVRISGFERRPGLRRQCELVAPHLTVLESADPLPVHTFEEHVDSRTSRTAPNVSADAGIVGNDQDPLNWGPPALQFASDLAGLNDGRYSEAAPASTSSAAESAELPRPPHAHLHAVNSATSATMCSSQQDPRGSFRFHRSAAPGPTSPISCSACRRRASIAFGNADKFFRSDTYAAGTSPTTGA